MHGFLCSIQPENPATVNKNHGLLKYYVYGGKDPNL